MFIDKVRIKLIAGKGGKGAIAFRREKYIPKGGPSGGDGGDGGSIIVETDSNLYSLTPFRNVSILRAQDGSPGRGQDQYGKKASNLTVKIPCGTLIKDALTGEILHDLTEVGQTVVICQGGVGGKGNLHFRSPTCQAPYIATDGTPGEEKSVEFELKLIADVGLVGFPNAGKSTLFQTLTDQEAKAAPYPFTTLHPQISFIEYEDKSRLFIADIPGLIPDAHQGRGLGIAFLRHIERTSVLLFVIDAAGSEERDPFEDFQVLRGELEAYNPELLQRPFLVALNKIDLPGAEEQVALFKKRYPFPQETLFEISALSFNKKDLCDRLSSLKKVETCC